MKAERQENHTKIVSGDLLGGPGAPRGPPLFPLNAFSTILAAPGGVREPSGELLGSIWTLLARLVALPGAFVGGSGAISGAVGRETRKIGGLGLMLGAFFDRCSCLLGASPALLLCTVSGSRSGYLSSSRSLLRRVRAKAGHA